MCPIAKRPPITTLTACIGDFFADERGAQVVEVALFGGVMSAVGLFVEQQAGRAVARLMWRVMAAFPV